VVKQSWRVVSGAVAGLIVCNGPLMFFTSGVFLKPIAADMQWPRSTVSFGLSLAGFLTAVTTPFLGRAMDRWGVRAVSLPGLPLFAVSLGLLALSPRSAPAFVFLCALAGVASTMQALLSYAKAIVTWFDNRRGLALGVAMTGVGLGAIIVPHIARTLFAPGRAPGAAAGALAHLSGERSPAFQLRDAPQVRFGYACGPFRGSLIANAIGLPH
jgi:MFS family permease